MPVIQQPITTCVIQKTICQKLGTTVRALSSSPTILYPAGICIYELATTIQIALKCAPKATRQVER